MAIPLNSVNKPETEAEAKINTLRQENERLRDYNTKLKSRANKKAKELRAKGNNVVIIKERKRNMLGAYSKGFNYVLYKRKK